MKRPPENRDGLATGCLSPCVADVARSERGDDSRQAFLQGPHPLRREMCDKSIPGDLDPAAARRRLG